MLSPPLLVRRQIHRPNGSSPVTISVSKSASVRQLKQTLAKQMPDLGDASHIRVWDMIDASDTTELRDDNLTLSEAYLTEGDSIMAAGQGESWSPNESGSIPDSILSGSNAAGPSTTAPSYSLFSRATSYSYPTSPPAPPGQVGLQNVGNTW